MHGRKHGFGHFFFKNGHIYSGNWKSDCMEGKGKYEWPDGRTYEGMMKNGEFHGYGVHIDSKGE